VPPSEFVMSIPYSAEKDDLYHSAQHAVFFPAGRRKSDAALCVLAALKVVCCRFHRTQSGSGDGETVGELAHARLPLPPRRSRAGQLCLTIDSGYSLARATPRQQLAA